MAANGISELSTKALRQVAKLNIAQAKRQGKTVAANGTITGAVDSTKNYYRARNTYDITQLPTQYSGNNTTDNTNVIGLVTGRPWANPYDIYSFSQAYWSALNGNATRMSTPTGNAQYFACDVYVNSDNSYAVNITGAGNSFYVGNWFLIPGTDLGGTSPANDLKITIASLNVAGVIATVTVSGTGAYRSV
jgi:hypothetical protein